MEPQHQIANKTVHCSPNPINDVSQCQMQSASSSSQGFLANKSHEQTLIPNEYNLWGYSSSNATATTTTPNIEHLAVGSLWPNNQNANNQPQEKLTYSMALFSRQNDTPQPQLENISLESTPASSGEGDFVPGESSFLANTRPFNNLTNPAQEFGIGTPTFEQVAIGTASSNESGNFDEGQVNHSYTEFFFKPNSSSPMESCMPIVQTMGRRCIGPRFGHTGPNPSEECEVYVGFLPYTTYENRIYPVFSRVGEIFQIRIHTSGTRSLGFCYVRYYTEVGADRAVAELTRFKFHGIKDNDPGITIQKVSPMSKIFIHQIPTHFDRKGIYDLLAGSQCGIGLISTDVRMNKETQTGNRGYCFLEYKNHSSALGGWTWILQLKPFGPQATVNWALPKKVHETTNGNYIAYNGRDLRSSTISIKVYQPAI